MHSTHYLTPPFNSWARVVVRAKEANYNRGHDYSLITLLTLTELKATSTHKTSLQIVRLLG